MSIFKQLFCNDHAWEIQPTYALLYYDRCKKCGKLRDTIGKTQTTSFKIGNINLK